jgi:hypothetical protein
MTIRTAVQFRNQARKFDRRISGLATVLCALRGGQTLQLHHTSLSHEWRLSGGQRVSDATAKLAIQDHHVVGVGDTLFADTRSQTYRYVY